MKVGQKRAREVGADDLIRKQYVQEIARIKTSLINMQDSWHAWKLAVPMVLKPQSVTQNHFFSGYKHVLCSI
jgi:predicted ATP-grasp superfamily ATP-dependent carboligase